MASVRKSLLFSIAGSYITMVLQVVGTLIMARLLTPEDTGVFAVTSAMIALAHNFRDMGVSDYIVQARELTTEKLRAAFTVTLTISWGMAVVIFLGSGQIARFYNHEGTGQIARVLALNYLLIPFGAIGAAYFQRKLDFMPTFLITTVSAVVGFIVAVALGLAGFGYMSLAWSSVAGVVASVVISVWLRPKEFPWLPGLKGCGDMLHFGKHIFFISLAQQAGRSAPDIIVGRMIGITPAGYFSRAGGLSELVNRVVLRAITPVCLPYFAGHAHASSDMKAGYLKAIGFLTVVAWPFYGFLGIVAYAAIRVFYGDQWVAAVPLAQVLLLAAAVEVTYSFRDEILISTGNVAKNSRVVLALQVLRTGLVLAAAPFGLNAVVWAMVVAAFMSGVLSQRTLRLAIGLHVREFAWALRTNALITVATLVPAVIATLAIGATPENYLIFFFGTGTVSALTWLLALYLTRHPLWAEIMRSWHSIVGRLRRR